jgi:hypothetical protein
MENVYSKRTITKRVGQKVGPLFFPKSHDRWVESILPRIKDVEHLILRYDYRNPIHIAVVITNDGACYVGECRFGKLDTYNRRRGFEISLGRGLKRAARYENLYDFIVDNELSGRDLRDECIRQLGLDEYYAEHTHS